MQSATMSGEKKKTEIKGEFKYSRVFLANATRSCAGVACAASNVAAAPLSLSLYGYSHMERGGGGGVRRACCRIFNDSAAAKCTNEVNE